MKSITTVEGIRNRFRKIVLGLDVDKYYKIFHTTPQHDGSAHIEKAGNEFHYVITERGQEFTRIRTSDPDEILYLLVQGVTHQIATQYELNNRIEGRDGRRIWFPYQENLLSKIKPEWGIRKKIENETILESYPFDDFAGLRVDKCVEFRKSGLSDSEAWKKACEIFPEPKGKAKAN